jgi:hypothetical protein
MATRVPKTSKKKSEGSKSIPTKTTITQVDNLKYLDGTVEGEYSRSVYVNNELVSFDIDWKKLEDYMKKVG